MELEVLLDEPFKVQADGALVETDVLFFNAPTPAMRKLRTKMTGIVFNAMLAAGKKFEGLGGDSVEKEGHTDSADDMDLDGSTILMMLLAADEGDALIKVQEAFDGLVVAKGIASCHESKVPMNKDLWAKVQDQDYVIGEYLANFIMPCLATMTKSKR